MMGHLNRLRNWWRDIYRACIGFRNQSSADPSAAYDIVVEDPERHEVAVDVPLTESASLAAPDRPAGEQTEPIKSSVPENTQEVSLPPPNITSPATTFTDPEYVITSADPHENIWTPEELGLEQEMLVAPPPPESARLSHKDSHSQPEAETNVAVQPVAPPVQLEAETEVQPVAPPVQLEAETEVQPVAPPVQLEAETEVQPVAPPVQLEAETEVQPVAPPVQLEAETEVQPVAPPVQLEAETKVQPVAPPVQLEAETEVQPVAPPVQCAPAGPVAPEPIVKSSSAQPQTGSLVTETVPKQQPNENRSPENASTQVAKPIKAETAKKQSKKKSNKISKVEVKVEEPKKPATVDTAECRRAGSAIRVGRDKYSPGAVTDETAQRLARLLISEIKLYNKVDTDSAKNNVYDVLKDPIDKARKYYGQRLGTAAIESMPDYFHAELVRTLCAGDASRLGPNYHGLKKQTIQEELVESL